MEKTKGINGVNFLCMRKQCQRDNQHFEKPESLFWVSLEEPMGPTKTIAFWDHSQPILTLAKIFVNFPQKQSRILVLLVKKKSLNKLGYEKLI